MKISISNNKLSASINLKGAELISLKDNSTQEEFIWEGNPDFWAKHSPILFPIVGTLKNNTYTINNLQYELTRHGFARDLLFKTTNKTLNSVSFRLVSDEYTKSNYPFDFELYLNYTLTNNTLEVSYCVINTGKVILPYSIGGHPAFSLKTSFENNSLEFEKNEIIKRFVLKNDLISDDFEEIKLQNKKLPLSYSLFENDAMIIKEMKSKEISIFRNEMPFLKFKFHDFPNFGIWTKIGAPFICLEPWAGYSDTLNNSGNIFDKEGIQTLKPKKEKNYSFSIIIL